MKTPRNFSIWPKTGCISGVFSAYCPAGPGRASSSFIPLCMPHPSHSKTRVISEICSRFCSQLNLNIFRKTGTNWILYLEMFDVEESKDLGRNLTHQKIGVNTSQAPWPMNCLVLGEVRTISLLWWALRKTRPGWHIISILIFWPTGRWTARLCSLTHTHSVLKKNTLTLRVTVSATESVSSRKMSANLLQFFTPRRK